MPRNAKRESDDELFPTPISSRGTKLDLTIKHPTAQPLNPAQEEFNKQMKALEKARAAHERKRARLDKDLVICRDELMPLVETKNRWEYELIFLVSEAYGKFKLTLRRRKALDALLLHKIDDLRGDPVGLKEDELSSLEALFDELAPAEKLGDLDADVGDAQVQAEFEDLRAILEGMAQGAGVDLDLSELDPNMDPDEFEQRLVERILAAGGPSRASRQKRKPSKAALERERLKQEAEEAKQRDLKSLYIQLAKVLHPDLETDATLKAKKEAWMKRLTSARANNDLREMLAIEVEWLGQEAGNLARATDEKLQVYTMVLKEQIKELKQQTAMLCRAPEYTPLRRFISPYDDRLAAHIIKAQWFRTIDALKEMASVLRAGGADARQLLNDSADHQARVFGL